jgi:T5SS/PEP-CTERM-associated repeat protein
VRGRWACPTGKSLVTSIIWLLCASAVMLCAGTVHAQYTGDNQTNIISGVVSNWSGDYVISYGVGLGNSAFDALLIQNGGVLSNSDGYIGNRWDNNLAVVSGSGSTWNNSGDLLIGQGNSTLDQLIITNGGAVYDNNAIIGTASPYGGGHSVVVTGSGSVWSNRNDLTMNTGRTVTIADGGMVFNNNALIGGEQQNQFFVTGNGSTWSIHGELNIDGTENGITVSNGGFVHSESAIMFGSNFSSFAIVTGAGSTWIIDGNFRIDVYGGFLTVADQGVVSVGGVDVEPNNQIAVSGGALYVTNGTATALLDASATTAYGSTGTLTLNSGTLTVDELVAGNVIFNGGVLRSKATTISGPSVFTVGDGTDVATFILDNGGSGFHSFANGLTISSYAMLKGNGTIVGATIVNGGGLLSPGMSPGSITFSNSLTLASGSTFTVELDGDAEGQYDRIVTLDTVSVSNSILNVSLGFTPLVGESFTIISNLGPGVVSGMFVDGEGNALANDATFAVDGTTFEISYGGNPDGQDVVLTAVVPEPGTWMLVGLGMVALYGGRRRRTSRTLFSRVFTVSMMEKWRRQ